jgi:hypothetical protein
MYRQRGKVATVHAGAEEQGGAGLKMGRKTTELERRSRTATTGFGQQPARFRYATSDVRHRSNGQSWPRVPKGQKMGEGVGTGAGGGSDRGLRGACEWFRCAQIFVAGRGRAGQDGAVAEASGRRLGI